MPINEHGIWMYIIVGFIPYMIKRRQTRGGNVLEVRALFWSLHSTRRRWTIRVPLIQRLRDVIWDVIKHLQEDDRSEEKPHNRHLSS